MSDLSPKGGAISRRAVTIGGGIATALGLAALGVGVPRWLGKRYAKTPYDDLLGVLTDRATAAKVGLPAADRLRTDPHYTVQTFAAELRKRLAGRTLAQATSRDIAEGHVVEMQGWVLPTTLTMLCVLAAAQER